MSQATFAPYGSVVSEGEFRCVDCGYMLAVIESGPLLPCPKAGEAPHEKRGWEVVGGSGDIPDPACKFPAR